MSRLESLDSALYEPLGAAEGEAIRGGLLCRIGLTRDRAGQYTIDDYDGDPQAN